MEMHNTLVPFLQKYCKNKIYLEAGANDGIRQSNTFLLEKYLDWKGILIEPNNFHFKACLNNRQNNFCLNKALVSSKYDKPTIVGSFGENAISQGLVGGVRFDYWEKHNELHEHVPHLVEVETTTLSQAIDESGFECPSFISLDIEGYELEALKGLDFSKHSPDLILIEILEWDIKEIYDQHINFLNENNYVLESQFAYNNNYLFYKGK